MNLKLTHPTGWLTIILMVLFCGFILFWEKQVDQREQRRLQEHARVIEPSLWALDAVTPQQYLNIAAERSQYVQLRVTSQPDNKLWIEMEKPVEAVFDRMFLKIGLIRPRSETTPVLHEQHIIGEIQVVRLHTTIYTYLYWSLVVALTVFGFHAIYQVWQGRRVLEARVKERTVELRRSEERLRAIVHSQTDAIIVLDEKNRVTILNRAAQNIFGLSAEKATGESVLTLLPEIFGEQAKKELSLLFQIDETSKLPTEVRYKKKTGRELTLEVAIAKGGMEEGAFLVCAIRDITGRKEMERTIEHSRRMDAIGKLAGGVAHDFNNMLGCILGATGLLKQHLPNSPEPQQLHAMILGAIDRASHLIKQLLFLAHKDPSVMAVINVQLFIEETAALLRSTIDKCITIKTDYGNEPLFVQGDAAALQSALLNLGVNAWHAMPSGGTLVFQVIPVVLDEVQCHEYTLPLQPGKYIEIQVRDTGCGISAENLPRIFEPFFTTKGQGKGTGLGLAAVFGAVKQHHGSIQVASEMGRGTTFRLLFPRSENKPAANAQISAPVRGKGTVLVVDDEAMIRAIAENVLKELGYKVLLAADGKEGVAIFQAHAGQVDLVVLDMIMPQMNGRDCFNAIRKIDPNAKIVAASGYTLNDDIKAMIAAGLCGFIQKPFTIAKLGEVVKDVLTPKHHV